MSDESKPKVAEHPVAARQIARARAWGALIGFVLAFWLSRRAGLPFPESGGRAIVAGLVVSRLLSLPRRDWLPREDELPRVVRIPHGHGAYLLPPTFAEAEELARDAYSLYRNAGQADCEACLTGQLINLRFQQGRLEEEINRIIVEGALAGKRVVRFKGGDNFVFGRGYEEVLACREAGVPVTVIPGLSSSVSVPAVAGIPVTHRGITHEFTVVSGHLPPGHPESLVNWPALGLLALAILDKPHRSPGQDGQWPDQLRGRHVGPRTPLGPPEMRQQQDQRALIGKLQHRRQHRAQPRVVGNRRPVHRHVEVDADKDALARQVVGQIVEGVEAGHRPSCLD